jgi:hypothetical protein
VAEYCKYTRRGCRRKAGAKSLGLAFGGFSLSKLASLAKKVKLPKGADIKKLKAKLEKHADTLNKHLDTLHEIANGSGEEEKLAAAFGKKRRGRSRKVRKSPKTHADFRRMPKKPPAKIRKICKKLKIKTTKKVGSRRVYKKLSELKKQIARKVRKLKKAVRKIHRRRTHSRR